MELELASEHVLVLGPGDDLDRAIARTLATEGASTLTTTNGKQSVDLRQQGLDTQHWVSVEEDINEYMAMRLRQFLLGLGKRPRAVIIHVDLVRAISSRGPLRLWKILREAKPLMKRIAAAALASIDGAAGNQIILVYRLNSDDERSGALAWLRHTMGAIRRSARRSGSPATANAVLVGADAALGDAAQLIAYLASPRGASVGGALIPVDDGRYLDELAA